MIADSGQHGFAARIPQTLRVTATAGVVQQQASASLDALLASADAALYAGKQAGRNRVVLAPALVAG